MVVPMAKKQPSKKTRGEKGRTALRPLKHTSLAGFIDQSTKLLELSARVAYVLCDVKENGESEAKYRHELALLNALMLLEDLSKKQLN